MDEMMNSQPEDLFSTMAEDRRVNVLLDHLRELGQLSLADKLAVAVNQACNAYWNRGIEQARAWAAEDEANDDDDYDDDYDDDDYDDED